MTLYLNYPINTKNENVLITAWSNTEIPVLATVTDKKKIIFYQDEGTILEDNILQKDKQITALTWHTNTLTMVYGFENGDLGVWIDSDNITKDDVTAHDTKVIDIKFNNKGDRVVSVDDRNAIYVWAFDGLFTKLCAYHSKFPIENIYFPHFNIEKYLKDRSNTPPIEKFDSMFFYTTSAGIIYLADDSQSSPEVCRVGGKIKSTLFFEGDNSLIVLTDNSLLVKSTISFDGNIKQKKTKLSIPGNYETIKCCWAGNGLLAIINEDEIIRLYSLETDRTYFISIADHYKGNIIEEDSIYFIEFSKRKRILFAGTKQGKVYLWKCNVTANSNSTSAESWEPFSIITLTSQISNIKSSKYMGLCTVTTNDNTLSMLSETILQKKSNSFMKIVQIYYKTLEIIINKEDISHHNTKRMEMKDSIKGLELYANRFIVWNASSLYLYEVLDKMVVSNVSTLKSKGNLYALNEDSIIIGNKNILEVINFQGEKKAEVSIEEKYGEVSLFNQNGRYLIITTTLNYFGVFDVQRRTLKLAFSFRKFEKNNQTIGEIREIVIDSTGKKCIILSDYLVNSEQRIPDSYFYIYSFETEQFFDHEISSSRIPIEAYFDEIDNRVFGIKTDYACDQLLIEEEIVDDKKQTWIGSEFYMFFHTTEYGIKFQETYQLNNDIQGVISINIPDIYFKVTTTEDQFHSVLVRKFQFFSGMERVTPEIKNILIEFSILISSGKIDEAYKIIQNIKNNKIWESIGAACIKTKRLDVLEVCLSNMRFAIGMKAFRESRNEKEIEVSLAMVAMHLNMVEQAIDLLLEVKRYDMLVRFYITIGSYDKAIDMAKTKNRINLENTYYRIAQHYERSSDIDKAMEFFKLSGCGNREIPRMLIGKGRIDLLEQFMSIGEDNNSLHWWAAYLEANGQIEKALEYYQKSKDWTNIVRVLLALERVEEAKKITDETKDQGSCFLMGKYYESIGEIKLAIYYYALSGRINQAFRLAREHNMDAEIYNLGLKANSHTQNLIGEYFENKGNNEKAVNLYIMAKNIKAAMNLCLATHQYDKLNEIAEMVEFQNDPDALRKLAEYFVEKKQYERALGIYIKLKDWEKCLYLCENYKIKISLNTANSMLKELDSLSDSNDKEKLTLRLAKQLKQQGDYQLAHDIYVKFGDLKRAMKCLIKQGNKEKVINFANTCRQNELYILAANFLQSLDWNDGEIVKNIVSFFSKAKAWTNLSSFYELFASVEITEYRNYVKALELYDEALKIVVNKFTDEEHKAKKEEEIANKIKITKIYQNALLQAKDHPDKSLALCNQMLNLAGVDNVVREIDIYTLMLEIYLTNKDYPASFSVLEVLRTMGKKIDKYVDSKTIEVILASVGKSDKLNEYISIKKRDEDEIGEELE